MKCIFGVFVKGNEGTPVDIDIRIIKEENMTYKWLGTCLDM